MTTEPMSKDAILEAADAMAEIKNEMDDLMHRARTVLRGLRGGEAAMIRRRAEAYWMGHIDAMLGDEESSCTSIPDTINELVELAGDGE